jgi:phage-related protein (TIGR01555 family)
MTTPRFVIPQSPTKFAVEGDDLIVADWQAVGGGLTGQQSGAGGNRFSGRSSIFNPQLNQMELLSYYIYSQPCANAVDVVPENSLKIAPRIVPLEEGICPDLLKFAAEFLKSCLPVVRLCAHHSRLYGWAIIPIFTDEYDLSLAPNYQPGGVITDIRSIPGGVTMDATVCDYWDDPRSRNYGEPLHFRITPGEIVHADRCILMKGLPDHRPLKMRAGYALGYSVIEPIAQAWQDYLAGICSNRKILDSKSIDVIKIANFKQILKSPRELKAVIAAIKTCREQLGGLILDIDGDYQVADRSLTGINDAMGQFMTQISMQANLSDTIVFGISPAGLTSGSYETGVLNKLTSNYQQSQLVPVWSKLLDTLFTLQGMPGLKYELKFPSSIEVSEAESAEINQAKAKSYVDLSTALATLVELNLMTREVAASIAAKAIDGINENIVMSTIGDGDPSLLPEEEEVESPEPTDPDPELQPVS